MVEGIAEQLLIPVLAEYTGTSLVDNHVAVLQVGGRYFEHFLRLFDQKNPAAINRKIACITDRKNTWKRRKTTGCVSGKNIYMGRFFKEKSDSLIQILKFCWQRGECIRACICIERQSVVKRN